MSRLWEKLTGTRHPADGVLPQDELTVRAALLGLNGRPDVRYRVRPGVQGEGADLVAECSLPEVGATLKVRIRLVPELCEVRALEERWVRSRSARIEYGRGPSRTVYRDSTWRFDTGRDFTGQLRTAVLAAGWTWRGVLRKP